MPIIVGLILWNKLPDKIPSHWNVNGEVDSYTSKFFAVVCMPFIMLAIQWLCAFATISDPKKQNHSEKIYNLVLWIIPLITLVLFTVIYTISLGVKVEVSVVLTILIGVVFVIIGNYLPKCKQNYTIGIKLPWTLNSEENWNKTHRLAGWIWLICGIAITLSGFFGFVLSVLISLPFMLFIPLIYSYVLYRKGI